jgi:hypothetical protein
MIRSNTSAIIRLAIPCFLYESSQSTFEPIISQVKLGQT